MEAENKYMAKQEEEEVLKRKISSHPLYGLLVETHLDCLKVGGMGEMDRSLRIEIEQNLYNKTCLAMLNQSDLDSFMEAYCIALGKLKEAMEEPQLKSMAFINNMYSQLRELTATTSHSTSPEPTTTTSAEYAQNADYNDNPS